MIQEPNHLDFNQAIHNNIRNNNSSEESLLRSIKKVQNIDVALSNASLVNNFMNGTNLNEQQKIHRLLLESTHNDLDVDNLNEHNRIHESNCSPNENDEDLEQEDDECGFNFVHKSDFSESQNQNAPHSSNKNNSKNKINTNDNSKSNRIANNMSPISIITLSSDSDEPERDLNGFVDGLETVSNQD
jgi:hypothetical protein